jgi:hypothetical protein
MGTLPAACLSNLIASISYSDPEEGGDMILWNIGIHLQTYALWHTTAITAMKTSKLAEE